MTVKKRAERGNVRQISNKYINSVYPFSQECKVTPEKISILTKQTCLVNGFKTRVLEINRQNFKLEECGFERGVWHVSGAFFRWTSTIIEQPDNFCVGGWYERIVFNVSII